MLTDAKTVYTVLKLYFKKKERFIMSMETSIIYGFGFTCDLSDYKLINFLKNHKNTFCQTVQEVELFNKTVEAKEMTPAALDFFLEDLYRDYKCDTSGISGRYVIISNIMSRETGIRFAYCQPDVDCDTLASVVFEERYPWMVNETEKELTEEKLSNICKKYMDELGITENPDYLNLEYYG